MRRRKKQADGQAEKGEQIGCIKKAKEFLLVLDQFSPLFLSSPLDGFFPFPFLSSSSDWLQVVMAAGGCHSSKLWRFQKFEEKKKKKGKGLPELWLVKNKALTSNNKRQRKEKE